MFTYAGSMFDDKIMFFLSPKHKRKDLIPRETELTEVTYFSASLFRSLFVEAQLAAGWVHVLSAKYLSFLS